MTDKVTDATFSCSEDKNAGEVGSKFGCGVFKPKSLQLLNRAPFLLAALSLCAICQGSIVNGFISTSISSIEKRFSLSSTQSGIFSAFYDIAIVLVLVPISYYGNKCHKGIIIATGMVLVGIGSIILILPHFLAGHYSFGEKQTLLCTNEFTDELCNEKAESSSLNKLWYAILLMSQLFVGIGAAPLFTLGISYMDENIAHDRTAVYLGVYMAVSTIGPALGFIVGGQLLRIWGDIGKTDFRTLGITGPSDPRWYGAWWIGFLVVGVLSIISAVPLFGFPKELPEKRKNRARDVKQTHKDLDRQYGQSFAEYPKIVFSLLKNPSVMALMMMQTIEAFLMNGFITFIPKVFENLFNFTASYASTLTGMIVVPMGLFGSLFGAFMAKKMMRFRSMIGLSIVFNASALLLCFIFFYQCKQLPLAGVAFDYSGLPNLSSTLNDTCNSRCHCDKVYNPVCNPDSGISYYSPCFAGCTAEYVEEEEWHGCACVLAPNFDLSTDNIRKVRKGLCRSSCSKTLFFIVFAILCFFTFSSAIPIQNASLRIVSFETRDVSIGLTWLFMRILGSIPGAVIFGFAIDRNCILWREECGEAQSCLRYNAKALSTTMLLFAVGLKVAILVCLALSYYFYKPVYDNDTQKPAKIQNGVK